MPQEILRITGISDTHFGSKEKLHLPPEEYKNHMQDMSFSDVIVHCGDFTDYGDIQGAKIAANVFKHSKVPVIGVLGNHDYISTDHETIRKILEEEGGIKILNGEIFDFKKSGIIVTFIGTTGFTNNHKSTQHRLLKINEKEYENLTQQQFLAFANCIKNLNLNNNIVLSHFQPVLNPRSKKDGQKGKQFRTNNLGDLLDGHRDDISIALHGHDHYNPNPSKQTLHGVSVQNIATPVTISITPDRPYRLIDVELKADVIYDMYSNVPN